MFAKVLSLECWALGPKKPGPLHDFQSQLIVFYTDLGPFQENMFSVLAQVPICCEMAITDRSHAHNYINVHEHISHRMALA